MSCANSTYNWNAWHAYPKNINELSAMIDEKNYNSYCVTLQ